jgi:hypothetical protein
MEPVAGLLLWIGDVIGVKWIRKENRIFKKLVKAITFLLIGVFILILYFMISFR